MLKVGIYCRVSTEEQKKSGNSLSTQEQLGVQWCKNHSYHNEVFSEQVSGGITFFDRPEFTRLFTKLDSGELNAIWVYDTDRLIRDDSLKYLLMKIIDDTGCELYINGVKKDINDEDKFIFGVYSLFADQERHKTATRMRTNRDAKWREGKGIIKTGVGWRKTKDKRALVDKEQAKMVVDMYETYLHKEITSYGQLHKKLLDKYEDLLPSEPSIARILKDEKYKGIQTIETKTGDIFLIDLGRIVSDELFNKVQKKINYVKGFRKANTINQYLLKGLVMCNKCGYNLWVKGGGTKESTYWYYKCNNHKETTISIPNLENMVWNSLFQILNNSEKVREEYRQERGKSEKERKELEKRTKSIRSKLSQLEKKKHTLVDALLSGDITKEERNYWIKNTYEKDKKVCNNELIVVNHKLSYFNDEKDIDNWVHSMKKDLKDKKDSKEFSLRRATIRKYIDKIGVEYKMKKGHFKYFYIYLELRDVNHIIKIYMKDSGGFAMMYPQDTKEYMDI